MNENYSNTLFSCIATSFLLLIILTVADIAPWMPMVGGIAPLIYYHFYFLAPKAKKGLSQPVIDSVYYFGFLITVAALAVTAVSIASKGVVNNITPVAFQFGLGLLATGYAVVARIHLTAASHLINELSAEEVMDRYVQKSKELVINVEIASDSFLKFANRLMEKTNEASIETQKATHKIMIDSVADFNVEINSIINDIRQGMIDVRELVNDTEFSSQRKELAKGIKSTISNMTRLSNSFEKLSNTSANGNDAVCEMAGNLVGMRDSFSSIVVSLRGAREELDKFSTPDGAISQFSQSVVGVNSEIVAFSTEIKRILTELISISSNTSEVVTTFNTFGEISKNIVTHMNTLKKAINSFEESSNNIAITTSNINKLSISANNFSESIGVSVGSFISNVKNLNDALVESTGGIKDTIFDSCNILEKNVELSSISVNKLSDNLVGLTEYIIKETKNHHNQ